MLTEDEKRWVKERQRWNGFRFYGCGTCTLHQSLCERTDCMLNPDFEDAAVFSERVAAKLSEMPFRGLSQHDIFVELRKTGMPFAWIALRNARFAVEEEMDGRG